jgi:hypothetical protein
MLRLLLLPRTRSARLRASRARGHELVPLLHLVHLERLGPLGRNAPFAWKGQTLRDDQPPTAVSRRSVENRGEPRTARFVVVPERHQIHRLDEPQAFLKAQSEQGGTQRYEKRERLLDRGRGT